MDYLPQKTPIKDGIRIQAWGTRVVVFHKDGQNQLLLLQSFTICFFGSFTWFSLVHLLWFSMVHFLWFSLIYFLWFFLWIIYYLFIYWANRSIFTIWQLLLFGPRLNFAKSLYNQADDGAKCLLKLEREKGEAFEIRNAFCDAVGFLLQICSRATIICRFYA